MGNAVPETLERTGQHPTKIATDHAIAELVAADGEAVVPADAALGWTDLGDLRR